MSDSQLLSVLGGDFVNKFLGDQDHDYTATAGDFETTREFGGTEPFTEHPFPGVPAYVEGEDANQPPIPEDLLRKYGGFGDSTGSPALTPPSPLKQRSDSICFQANELPEEHHNNYNNNAITINHPHMSPKQVTTLTHFDARLAGSAEHEQSPQQPLPTPPPPPPPSKAHVAYKTLLAVEGRVKTLQQEVKTLRQEYTTKLAQACTNTHPFNIPGPDAEMQMVKPPSVSHAQRVREASNALIDFRLAVEGIATLHNTMVAFTTQQLLHLEGYNQRLRMCQQAIVRITPKVHSMKAVYCAHSVAAIQTASEDTNLATLRNVINTKKQCRERLQQLRSAWMDGLREDEREAGALQRTLSQHIVTAGAGKEEIALSQLRSESIFMEKLANFNGQQQPSLTFNPPNGRTSTTAHSQYLQQVVDSATTSRAALEASLIQLRQQASTVSNMGNQQQHQHQEQAGSSLLPMQHGSSSKPVRRQGRPTVPHVAKGLPSDDDDDAEFLRDLGSCL